MLRSCGASARVRNSFRQEREGGVNGLGEGGGDARRLVERRTESVHLNWPRNIRVSVVVTRKVLFRSEVR
jgi:hypothetical protein